MTISMGRFSDMLNESKGRQQFLKFISISIKKVIPEFNDKEFEQLER